MTLRGAVPELTSRHPLGVRLPALYQSDEFAQRLVSVFDDALAPVLATLDDLDAYFDPHVTPDDFLHWLAGWVGVALDEAWPVERRRELVARAAELHRWRGTVRGLTELVAIYAGETPEIEDSGGTSWSSEPDVPLPGRAQPSLTVRLRVPDPATVDVRRLEAIVVSAKPAHVPHRIEVSPSEPSDLIT